jgi:DNA-binding NarL/FixJ family response regulator
VIVDDNERFADVTADLLAKDGFAVVGRAHHSGEALQVIVETHPDLVLIDLYLGNDSGVELIRQIIHRGLAAQTFLLRVSSCAAADLHNVFEASDAHACLTKTDLSGGAIRALLDGARRMTRAHGNGDRAPASAETRPSSAGRGRGAGRPIGTAGGTGVHAARP